MQASSTTPEQNVQGPGAAIHGAGGMKRQHVRAPAQPAADLAFEHRAPLPGAVPLTMNDSHTALAPGLAPGEELAEDHPGLGCAHAVQVDLRRHLELAKQGLSETEAETRHRPENTGLETRGTSDSTL